MENDPKIVHSFDSPKKSSGTFSKTFWLFFAGAILLGVLSGYILSGTRGASVLTTKEDGTVTRTEVKKGDVVGSKDDKTFKDKAEGILKAGGVEGEGAFHLERPGGVSQNVYLTSSVLDLSAFEGKKVKVWGETFEAEKAGWLMDVGRLQVLD